ncbi:hypothetical protein OO012_06750 [Rhodobacteraceae bacterium KMM 6894]|nr:hypothetical protein [Rhodobacteraceae bacterium KMM 6894]
MAVLFGDLVNRYNMNDQSNPLFQIGSPFGLQTLTIGGRTFVYVGGGYDDEEASSFPDGGLSVFELFADGTLVGVENISLDDFTGPDPIGGLKMVTIDGSSYLYADRDHLITVFQVAGDGTLSEVQTLAQDPGPLPGDGPDPIFGNMAVTEVGGVSYLISGRKFENAVSVFSIAANGALTETDILENTEDTPFPLINRVRDITTATVGGNTFVFVPGQIGDGISSFQLMPGGTLTFVDGISDSEAPGLKLNGAYGTATATIGGTTYLYVSSTVDDGISVFSVDSAGMMTNVSNFAGTPDLPLDIATGLSVVTMGAETFLMLSVAGDGQIVMFHAADDGSLSVVTSVDDTLSLNLGQTIDNAFTVVDGVPIALATGLADGGFSSFEIGAGDDTLNGTIEDDTIMGLNGDDLLIGAGGNDSLLGGDDGGNDTLRGGIGDDTLRGGDGDDLLIGDLMPGLDMVTLDLNLGGETDDVAGRGSYAMPAGDMTIELLYQTSGTPPSSTEAFFHYEVNGTGVNEMSLFADTDGELGLTMFGTVNTASGVPSSLLYDGEVHRISVRYDQSAGIAQTYIDGEQVWSLFVGTDGLQAGGALVFGQEQDGEGMGYDPTQLLSGKIADMRVWSDLRTTTEIRDNAFTQIASPASEPGLLNNWRPDPANAPFLFDATGPTPMGTLGTPPFSSFTAGVSNNDRVYDGRGNDTVLLGEGDDYVRAGGGADSYDGGSGTDYISYYDSTGGVDLYLGLDLASGSWANNDTISGFEGASGSATGDDSILGSAGANIIRTYGGDDTIKAFDGNDLVEAGSGDDFVQAGAGQDSYYGGSGDDLISYHFGVGGITLDLQANTVSGGSAYNDIVEDFESVIATTGDDTIYGTSGANSIWGGEGKDRVYDRGGNDTVSLGDGDDYVRAGGGADAYYGGNGNDYISYYDSSGGVNLDFATNGATGSWANNDVVEGFEGASGSKTGDDTISGTSGENIIRTYGGNDRVFDQGGADLVQLGSGDDYVRAGGGADTYDGGADDDYISYYDSFGGVNLDFAANTATGSWANNDIVLNFEGASGSNTGNDTLRGTDGESVLRGYGGNDRLHGRDGDDSMVGGSGADSLYGGAGGDTMRGGSGDDYLDGGGGSGTDLLYGDSGADEFHFDRGEGDDVIKDFENNLDTIAFDNFGYLGTATDALDFASNVSGDVLFDFGADGTLLVENATIAQLANDIEIV